MSGTEYEFYALTPIDDADIGVYEEALDFVFENDSVRNVAVSGSYGSGKSSVLASYKKKHPDKKFLHISLAHFRAANGDEDAIGKETEKSTETILEGKILNQLIHQIPPKNIPQTNFKVKKELSKKRIIVTTALVMLGAIFGLLVFFSTQWLEFVQSLSIDYLKNLLWFSGESDTRFFMGVLFFAMVGVFLYRLIKLQENHHIIKRASVSGVEIEVLEDSKESYFDKYLNEVLYLFEKSGAAVIVFEDIDRYDSSKIFERLHEINRLTNDNLMNTKKKPLRFFYLMRDDIFVSKDRAKFFDFILPIVPVVDGSNSYDKFIECFQKSGLIGDEQAVLDQDFLQGLSLYIDDMRILQNICNEFLVYHSRISTTEQDPNKMLALIAVKNLFPRDFADLQLGRGFMFEVIGGHGKERLIESEKARLNEEIESKRKMLEAVQNEHLPSDEIILLYHTKFYIALRGSGTTRFQPSDNPQTCKQDLENNRQYLNQHNALLDEYDTRIETSAASDDEKTRRISDLETKIDDLKAALVKLTGLRLRDIISRDNIKGLFKADFESETGKNNRDFTQIKDSPYSAPSPGTTFA